MPTVTSGRPVTDGGWFVDQHGHRLLLRAGELAPVCPHLAPAPACWRLVAPLPLKV
jgi:hypothetical protein